MSVKRKTQRAAAKREGYIEIYNPFAFHFNCRNKILENGVGKFLESDLQPSQPPEPPPKPPRVGKPKRVITLMPPPGFLPGIM